MAMTIDSPTVWKDGGPVNTLVVKCDILLDDYAAPYVILKRDYNNYKLYIVPSWLLMA